MENASMKERIWVRFSRLGKTARIKRGIALGAEACISVICLVMAVVYGVNGDPYNRLFSCLMAGLLLWVPIIVERLAKHRFSFTQHAAFIILLAGGAVAGSVFYLFYLTDWFDCFMHVLAGYVLMIFLLTLQCRKLNEIENGGLSDRKSALSCTLTLLLASLGTACLWELVEFIGDMFFGQTAQGAPVETVNGKKVVDISDTMLDIISNFGGAVLFLLHYALHKLTKRSLLLGAIVKDFCGRPDEVSDAPQTDKPSK